MSSVESALQLVQRMRDDGASTSAILTELAFLAEKISGPHTTASILILDKDGLLRNGASPGLPADYVKKIDGIRPDPAIGTFAAAAATGQIVVTPDFYADKKWAELRHLPLELGYVSAWSVPIKSSDGTVLGTFGIYFRIKRTPSQHELESVPLLAKAASVAL